MRVTEDIDVKTECYHCGDAIKSSLIHYNNQTFCCLGCKSVYQILQENDMHFYYKQNQFPGKNPQIIKENYDFLDEEKISRQLIDFKDDKITLITFYIPVIHCSSCIWLLERLYKIEPAILQSRSDFMKKQLTVTFKNELSLKELVNLLVRIGYEPKITLQDVVKEKQGFTNRKLISKIAVAGFCFGNSMMLSFPDYFGMGSFEAKYAHFFGYLNLAFGMPVLLYSATDYFTSAWNSLKQKRLNLDVPLALGIFILFIRTAYEVLSHTGPGFGDTLCGLVFFILIGKWVQQKTYYHLSFERDYRSYFPVAVTCINEGNSKSIPISELKIGDRILIRNQEIIPADSILLKGKAEIDFSFVTGESVPVEKVMGEIIYAGGRQTQEAIELEIVKNVSQSYLTRLWNQENFNHSTKKEFKTFTDTISKYFTVVLISIALLAMTYWVLYGQGDRAWGAFTAVLIIACPCALALTSPFTLSAALSIFDKNKFYIKNTASIEKMASVNTLVFDKTGTISSPNAKQIQFKGKWDDHSTALIFNLCRNSNHPLSREIVSLLGDQPGKSVESYQEIIGSGLSGEIEETLVRIGSAQFLGLSKENVDKGQEKSVVHVEIGGEYRGYFEFQQPWREGLHQTIQNLTENYTLHLISGDNPKGSEELQQIFPQNTSLIFNQLPHQKLEYIQALQKADKNVCMIGDGLNDAAALKQADLGIAISDNINNFSPGCDAILAGQSFTRLPQFFNYAKDAMKVIRMSFGISLLYNAVGLSFAVQGTMSPLFAAILMPLSTVTIISFTSLATHYYARKNGLKNNN